MKASVVRARYDVPEKDRSRDLVMAAAMDCAPESVLDLWGGGASARAFRAVAPDAAIVSAESDPELWPALRLDAMQHSYVPHLGDVETVKGVFDFIWLDLCCQWCGSARTTLAWGSRHLTKDGVLGVTILAARETPEIAADRLFLVPKSIERTTGRHVQVLFPYQTGSPMWLLLLGGEARWSWWSDIPERMVRVRGSDPLKWDWSQRPTGTPFDHVKDSIDEMGFFVSGWQADRSDHLWQLLESLRPEVAA